MIVVDTNILIYYFVKGDYTSIASAIHAKDSDWAAPFLWRSEFRNIMMLYLRKEILPLLDVLRIIEAAQLLMENHEFHVSTSEVYRLAMNSDCTAYDCEFVALAQSLNTQLVTADRQILHAFPKTAVSPQQFTI